MPALTKEFMRKIGKQGGEASAKSPKHRKITSEEAKAMGEKSKRKKLSKENDDGRQSN